MNIATGSLLLVGFILVIIGMVSKIIGISLLAPFFGTFSGYLIAANTCLLIALAVDKFHKS